MTPNEVPPEEQERLEDLSQGAPVPEGVAIPGEGGMPRESEQAPEQ